MTVIHYHQRKNGQIAFTVDSAVYPQVLMHLRTKGLSTGGSHSTTDDLSDIIVDATIDRVNEALRDFHG